MHRSILLMLLLTVASPAADWPHVRGLNYDAHSPETGFAENWPEAGPPVLWTRELGPGYSAFVVADNRAYTLFQNTSGMYLIALDADNGAELWKERVDWPWQPGGMYPGPYASPTYHEGHVYYATPTGIVGCVVASSGRSVWTVNVRERFGSRGTEFGYASTPTVEDGRVYLPVGGASAAMVALKTSDGSTLWASGDEPASYCPAYPITLNGRRLIVGFLQNSLMLFDAKTGERVWREHLSASYDEHAAWPIFDSRDLLISSPFRVGSQLYRFSDVGAVTAKPIWSGRHFCNDVCSSLLANGHVYGFDIQQAQASTHRAARGTFKCIDFATGKTRWESGDIGQASVVHAEGKLILWSETGTLILARENSARYEEHARAKVLNGGGMCWAAPALSDKRLIVRDHQRAVCLYLGPPADLVGRETSVLAVAASGFDWTRLVPKEPEYANDAPRVSEIGEWFAWCVGILILAAVVSPVFRRSRIAFLVTAFVLGAVGTTIIGVALDRFVWTWPVSLYAAFRGVLALGLDRTARGWRHQVLARAALLLFIAACYGYYLLCMAVGYALAWGFLGGFVPALPLILLARRTPSLRLRGLLEGVCFAVYFWVSGLIPILKAEWIE